MRFQIGLSDKIFLFVKFVHVFDSVNNPLVDLFRKSRNRPFHGKGDVLFVRIAETEIFKHSFGEGRVGFADDYPPLFARSARKLYFAFIVNGDFHVGRRKIIDESSRQSRGRFRPRRRDFG